MLTDTAIRKAKIPGKLADGGGLYLLVKATGGKWWRFKYRRPVTRKENLLTFGACQPLSWKMRCTVFLFIPSKPATVR